MLSGFLVSLLMFSPLLFGMMYLIIWSDEDNELTIKDFYLKKNEDSTLFAHILWLVFMFYSFILINYVARFLAYLLSILLIKDYKGNKFL